MIVLIAGCGELGTAAGLLLAARGHRVRGVRRQAELLPRPIEPIAADLADPDSLPPQPDVDVVIHTATADLSTPAAYQRAYVDGLRHALRACPAAERVLFTSSTAVYGQDDGSWVDESSPTEPTSFRGETMLAAEGLAASSGRLATAVRASGVYGPGRTRLIDSVRRGEATCRPDPPQYTNRIRLDDLAGLLAQLVAMPSPPDRLVASDDLPAPRCEVLRWIADRLGAPEPRIDDSIVGSGKRCANAALRATGYELAWPTYRDGFADMLDGPA